MPGIRLFWYLFAVVVAFAMEAEPATASPALPPGGLVATRTTAEESADGKQVLFAAPAYERGEPVHGPGRGPDRLDLVAIE